MMGILADIKGLFARSVQPQAAWMIVLDAEDFTPRLLVPPQVVACHLTLIFTNGSKMPGTYISEPAHTGSRLIFHFVPDAAAAKPAAQSPAVIAPSQLPRRRS